MSEFAAFPQSIPFVSRREPSSEHIENNGKMHEFHRLECFGTAFAEEVCDTRLAYRLTGDAAQQRMLQRDSNLAEIDTAG